ncbi:hypothetical protein [Agrobacterium sp. NPDC089420]|uniref:hypothetical protein n=1 Tax=Agrobacterium sp. NPDC089420 TaxID=3363918 RepID=UPI0038501648
MSKSSTHYNNGHLIHLLPRFEAAMQMEQARAPEALMFPRRMGFAGRISFALMSTIASAIAAGAIFALWTSETPGWWFNVLFTVMLSSLAGSLWAILISSIRLASLEHHLQAVWRDIGPTAVATSGRVKERYWALAEDGSVLSFTLVVQGSDRQSICGEWQPVNSREYLLQTQVPGIGSEVRIWRVPDAAIDAPLVIEVADPSVVV